MAASSPDGESTGHVQAAQTRGLRKGLFNYLMEALHQRFKPDSRRELYAVKFQMRRKRKTESWATFGNNICALADKAFPKLGAEGR